MDINQELENIIRVSFGKAATMPGSQAVPASHEDGVAFVLHEAATLAADRLAAVLDGQPRHELAPPRMFNEGVLSWYRRGPLSVEANERVLRSHVDMFDVDEEFSELGYIAAATIRKDILDSLQQVRGYVQDARRRLPHAHTRVSCESIGYPHYVLDQDTRGPRRAFAGRVLHETLSQLGTRGYPVVANHRDTLGRLRRLVVLPKQ